MTRKGGVSAQVETSPGPASFPVRERGCDYADFTVGRTFEHANRRTVLESDNVRVHDVVDGVQPALHRS